MKNEYLFDKVVELKEKFRSAFVQKKKLTALENFSICSAFKHKDYLTLIKKCMGNGFLGEKESDFLSHLLEEYEINFLDWAHKTKWLKGEMSKLKENQYKKKHQAHQLSLFEYKDIHPTPPPNIPFELLKEKTIQKMRTL